MSTTAPPPQVEAELFIRPMTSGRSGAALIRARGQAGPVDCVVKLAGSLPMAPLEYLSEWVATAIAARLDVPVPEALQVEVGAEFALSIQEPKYRAIALKSVGSAFGSRLVTAPFVQWLPAAKPPPDLRDAAMAVLGFDLFIHNVDRRIDNANLLASRTELVAIDHADAFAFLYPLIGRVAPPETDPLFDVLERHVFGRALKGQPVSFGGFRQSLQGLTDDVLGDIKSATPKAWMSGRAAGKLDTILEVLRVRRNDVERWLPKVEAWLAS